MAPAFVSYTGAGGAAGVTPTTGNTTANIAVLTGDLVVIAGASEESGTGNPGSGPLTISLTGGLTGTLTVHRSDFTASNTAITIGSATVTADGNLTGKVVGTGVNTTFMNVSVWVYRSHGGVGVTNISHQAASTVPSVTLTGCGANSAIVGFVSDWAAKNGARTYTQINGVDPTERGHYGDAVRWHYDAFDYADSGGAGNQTLGESAPTLQQPNIVGVEVRSAGGVFRTFNAIPFM